MMLRFSFFCSAALLASCGESGPKFERMQGLNNFSMLIEKPIDTSAIEAAAKEKCRDQEMCAVYGWTDETNMATALPMLDREVAGLVFTYDLNRNTGREQALWDCRVVKRNNPNQCLAKDQN